jgi:hypothetical protein
VAKYDWVSEQNILLGVLVAWLFSTIEHDFDEQYRGLFANMWGKAQLKLN